MSNRRQRRFDERLYETPLMILPEAATVIAKFGDADLGRASAFRGKPKRQRLQDGSTVEMYRVEDGVAIIPVMGELVNRGGWIGPGSGLMSYEGLTEQLRAACADPNVRGILLDIDSPGGEARGAMEAGAAVRRASLQKPVVAFVNGMAASAGYAIATGAMRIITTPSAMLGSIGVVFLHIDRSGALAKAGIKVTLIYAGDFKADYSGLRPLPDDARARIQASVNKFQDLFVSTVAAHRSMAEEDVRSTKGGLLMGRSAVDMGLADEVGDFEDAMRFFGSSKPARPTQSDIYKLPEAGRSNQAAQKYRERLGAIMRSEAAKGRQEFAEHLAFETDLHIDTARTILAKAPLDKPVEALVKHAPVVLAPEPAKRGPAVWLLRVRQRGSG